MITQLPSSLLRSKSFKLEKYDAENSILKEADPKVLDGKLAAEPSTGKHDIFIRSDVPENERVSSIYEGFGYDEVLACDSSAEADNNSVRVVSGMSNRELYELLMGEKCPRASSGDIDFNSNSVDMLACLSRAMIKQSEGIGTMQPTHENIGKFKENIAKFYGEIAKRMDAAYTEGKFTDEEYEMLNAGLNERIEKTIHNTERSLAFYALGRQIGAQSPEERKQDILRKQAMTPEERRAEMARRIDEYINRHCKIDRGRMFEMINAIRYGVDKSTK